MSLNLSWLSHRCCQSPLTSCRMASPSSLLLETSRETSAGNFPLMTSDMLSASSLLSLRSKLVSQG